jgi:uncharacterized tellurite resistance protein B-like protein
MTPIQNLHYAIGEIAYAIARVDGNVQREETKKFMSIVAAELRCKDYEFDVSDIIFQVLAKEKVDAETSYEWAMNEIRLNSHYLSPSLKATFISVIEKIARAFPPVTESERDMIERFKRDIAPVQGDPVYYEKQRV